MRRFALTIFVFFYTASVAALTMERTESWANERAHAFKHGHYDRAAQIGEPHKHTPHQVQTKLLEDGSVLVSSFVRSSDPPYSETPLHHRLNAFVADPNGRLLSSRAPPALL